MRKDDAEKIVAATAAAGVLFVGLAVFRLAKGLILLGQLATRGRQDHSWVDAAREEKERQG